jgi:hypothetical protein
VRARAQAQSGADLIAGDIEELRAAIHSTLRKIEQPEPTQPKRDRSEGANLVYLLCDERDRKATVPLRKLCKQLGIEVALPFFEGDASQVRSRNQQLLASCDAVVLYYGAGDEAWKRTIDSELKKMAAYRNMPLLARFTYLAEPRTSDKDDLIDMGETGLIDGLGGFAEPEIIKSLRPLAADGVMS